MSILAVVQSSLVVEITKFKTQRPHFLSCCAKDLLISPIFIWFRQTLTAEQLFYPYARIKFNGLLSIVKKYFSISLVMSASTVPPPLCFNLSTENSWYNQRNQQWCRIQRYVRHLPSQFQQTPRKAPFRCVWVRYIWRSDYSTRKECCKQGDSKPDWRFPLIIFLTNGCVPQLCPEMQKFKRNSNRSAWWLSTSHQHPSFQCRNVLVHSVPHLKHTLRSSQLLQNLPQTLDYLQLLIIPLDNKQSPYGMT